MVKPRRKARAGEQKPGIFRLKTVEGLRKNVDLGLEFFRDVVSRCCLEVDGFLAGYFLVDRRTGRTVTLSLWRDEAALDLGLGKLTDRMKGDERAAAMAERINARGVRFDTFELACGVVPAGTKPRKKRRKPSRGR